MNEIEKKAIEEIPVDAVIQALKCCASEEDNCHRCPFMGVGGISDICITAMSRAALDLIYRKQSEGEWIKDNTSNFEHRYNCSVCDFRKIGKPTPYCPNCGARMKGGE